MYTDVDTSAIFPEAESKVLKISDCKHTDRTAFLPVHLQLQFTFKIFRAGLQQSFRGSLAFRKQYDVIRIADARYAPSVEFPVKLIEIDIGEQGRKISSLCGVNCYAELSWIFLTNERFLKNYLGITQSEASTFAIL